MKRSQLKQLNDAHIALTEWAQWEMTHMEASCIGYAGRTVEGRAQTEALGVDQSGFYQGRCPNVMMPRRIKKVDNAIRDMPELVRMTVWCKYWPERALEHTLDNIPDDVDLSGELNEPRKAWTEGRKLKLFREITNQSMQDYYSLWEIGKAFVAGRL